MAPQTPRKTTRSRIESATHSTAKPIASPRAEVNTPATRAKTARHKAHALDPDLVVTSAGKSGKKSTGANKAKGGKAKLLDSKVVYKGRVFDVHKDTVVEPNGKEATREVIRHNGSVVILGVDDSRNPDDPDVILIRQYRHAAGQFLIELPAGRVDPGEQTLAAAKREMIEETGFRAKRWTLLVKYYASPGFLGEWMQIYLARDLRAGTATPEEDEQIELLPTPLSEAMGLIAEGKIHDGKTLIGLSLLNQARLDGRL